MYFKNTEIFIDLIEYPWASIACAVSKHKNVKKFYRLTPRVYCPIKFCANMLKLQF